MRFRAVALLFCLLVLAVTFAVIAGAADGSSVVGEPQGSPAWYPLNDTPRDKATFDFSVSAPQGLTVMANGVLVSHATSGDRMSLGHFFDVWLYQPKKPVSR